ncbi:hypothetical protein ACYZT3_27545 [Pseudomonas sp. MDT1-16]
MSTLLLLFSSFIVKHEQVREVETKVYANKGWQHIGKVEKSATLYADGEWYWEANDNAKRCNSRGRSNTSGNYYVREISKGDTRYPYSDDGAVLGQLVIRVGENGHPVILDDTGCICVVAGLDLWMCMNELGISDNDGYLTLRVVSEPGNASPSLTNSFGHPIGTQYTRNAAGGYDRIK